MTKQEFDEILLIKQNWEKRGKEPHLGKLLRQDTIAELIDMIKEKGLFK